MIATTLASGNAVRWREWNGTNGGRAQSGQRPPAILVPEIVMRAVRVHHTETVEGSWDGPETETRVRSGEDEAYYRQIYAWQDLEANPRTKSAWKFIHHEVSGDGEPGAANLTACSAGIAVLNDGRGGTTAPEVDHPGIYAHLAAHLRDGGREPPPLRGQQARQWWTVRDELETAELIIMREIGGPFAASLGLADSAEAIQQELARLDGRPLMVRINSPGGDVFEGVAIYNLLRDYPGRVQTRVEGIAASIASVIALAGDEVVMAPSSLMMIHDPIGWTEGTAADHLQTARVLETIAEQIAAVYRGRGDARINWRERMRAETWLTAEEAVAVHLADRIDEQLRPTRNHIDLSWYRHPPTALLEDLEESAPSGPTKRAAERALREAGLSARAARAVIATGWRALEARDEPEVATVAAREESERAEPTPSEATDAHAVATVSAARARALALMALELGETSSDGHPAGVVAERSRER